MIVDGAQAAALASLPFASDLEIVARSRPLPGTILCSVGARLGGADARALLGGLERLSTRPEWAEVLKTMRMTRFQAVDTAAVDTARRACVAARASRP